MQLRHALTTALLASCCVDTVLGRNILRPRQDPASTSPAPTDDGATASNTSPVSSATPTQTSDKSTSTKDNADKTTTDGGATHVLTTSKSSATAAAGSKNATETVDKEDELPLQPIITPAVGLAGAILMITGVAYTIIGIKHKWLLVFLSAAYLASLSITVLIIYVMSPPVSDAIQGAYFVAAFFTGVIFGGISLVFKEVTEGFGCIVGGFCMAMWFLVLKPGGLIESTTGRAIMIGAFSAVGWSLAFSQYTRTYGTIICTSFGGAMITMIGIDCFSRAGLKEFWIYIWALNDAEFPIHTNTYPITRGIRVEIAGTVVLCLFGIMSQIKVWKIVKERKLKNEAVRLRDDKKRELRDSKIGKQVNENNERSLARWEALYGNAGRNEDSTTSTEDSDPKKSTSVAEREIGSIEMDDMSSVPGDRGSKQIHHSVMEVVPEQEPRKPELQLDFNDQNDQNDYGWWSEDFRSTKTRSNVPSFDEGSLAEMVPSPTAPPVPPVPYMESPASPKEEVKSDDKPVHERRGIPLDALGLQKLNEQQAPAALPRIEDDRASSVAATLDDEPEMNVNRLSVAPSLYQQDGVEKGGLSPFSDEFKVEDTARGQSPARTPASEKETPVLEDDDDEVLVRPPTADAEAGASRVKWSEAKRDSQSRGLGIQEEAEEESESTKPPSIHSLREERLPESISKVAMAYRTNEWAKHIADAPQPDVEEEPQGEVEEASVQVQYQRPATATAEKARSVDPEALLATGAPQPKSPPQATNPSRQPSRESKVRRHSNNATPVYAFQRTNSDQSQSPSLQRQGSSNSMQQPRLARQTSQPLSNQILVESPIEEAATTSHYETPLGSTLNLLDARNSRLDNRMTTTSFNALNVPISTTPLSETGTATSSQDIPLSQRKDLIDQGVIRPMSPPQQQQRGKVRHSGSTPNILRSTSSSNQQNLIYDSHQPRRSNTHDTRKQSQMLSQWRQSLQAESSQTPTTMLEEQARMQMIMQQRHHEHQSRKKEREREGRERERDVAMRTSMLAGAHQDALRRMQAKADTGLGGQQKK